MIKDELTRFIENNEEYIDMCSQVLDSLHLNENTVAAFTRCGTKTGTAFLTHNFTRIFGYSRKQFIEGDLQFLIKHMHASDVKDFIYFAERSTLNAAPWKEAGESAVHQCCIRFKHFNGRWMWLNQKVIVLSVTPDRHIDHVLLLFDDCTAAKQAELSRHGAQVEKSRKNSKLLNLLAPIKVAQTNTDQQVPASEGCASLTSREREIMQLVSQG